MYKKLIILSVLLIGTQQVRMPVFNLTLFQMSIVLVALVGLSFTLRIKIPRGTYLPFSAIYLLSGVVAFIISESPNGQSLFLLSTMTAILTFLIPITFQRTDSGTLVKALVRSQYIVIPFSIFMWWFYNLFGGIPRTIELPGGLAIELSQEFAQRSTIGTNLRLSLPYATPPVLSVAMAMTLVMLFYAKHVFKTYERIALMVVFTIILIFTGSRTGVIGIGLFVAFRLFTGKAKLKMDFLWIFLTVSLGCALIVASSEVEYLEMFLGRFNQTDGGLENDRHWLVPIDGLLIWISSLKNFLIGIGFGNSEFMQGAHTFLPPHFLNSFVTLIAERGIMGFYLVLLLIKSSLTLWRRQKLLTDEENAISFALITGLFSTPFYETFNCYFIIYLIAITLMLELKTRPTVNPMFNPYEC